MKAFLAIILLCSGCAADSIIKPNADGKSHRVWASDFKECLGFHSVEHCEQGLKPVIFEKAKRELCNGRKPKLFGCRQDTLHAKIAVSCNVTCLDDGNEFNSSDEIDAAAPSDSPANAKAKKCKDKGGVWKSDRCQINAK